MKVKCVMSQAEIDYEGSNFTEGKVYDCEGLGAQGQAYVNNNHGQPSLLYEGEFEGVEE